MCVFRAALVEMLLSTQGARLQTIGSPFLCTAHKCPTKAGFLVLETPQSSQMYSFMPAFVVGGSAEAVSVAGRKMLGWQLAYPQHIFNDP